MEKKSLALRALQFVLDAADMRAQAQRDSGDGPAATPASHAKATGGVDATSDPRARAAGRPEVFIPSEGRGVQRGTMSGTYDTVNVGQFAFSLMCSNFNIQLSVGQIRTPGNVGGLFSLETIPASTWVRLEDRQGRQMPVWILVHDESAELLVGAGPDRAPILRPVDRGQSHG